MDRKEKQPSEFYDYYITGADYFEEIEDDDEIQTIVTSKDITTVPDLTVGDAILVGDNPQDFKIWLGAGLDGTTYTIKCLVTTLIGRIEEFEFRLKVKEKR